MMGVPAIRAFGLAVAVICGLTGCSIQINGDSGDAVESLESRLDSLEPEIRTDLGDQLSRSVGSPVEVRSVRCSGVGAHRFECFARARARDLGTYETESIPVSGSCDSRNCIWHAGY